MDPDTTLERIRRFVDSNNSCDLDPSEVDELTELFESLDAWLASGGFLPFKWAKARRSL
ncbi:hypothetical protein SEA_STROSAHL_87 [Gordonia phage Strosahl]|uniref:Uncharacterized protein n=3 Tax=Soupsvirus TaxID=1982562 RepID=A0A1B3B186_9CAUD|nr:HNH endonuclease [Gordonia phage Rosalind]YP_009269384.1 HNH endonuclease [Gordonia phage Soups]YP_009281698.1 HNH endonuclease [Gordonia phage Remus]YP_009596288.1 HNH endonuclease [Gordonia phage Strosahl]QLF84956.1 hypothetical protein SEA_EPSOCAMISIO_84 [Gordonia phage Epsocamisio]ANA87021.1 hypothetical protein PBI_SOUPS_86 [Gordonia phage Soups]ANA87118.1 hypothetical protein PBI_ROSALIND_85 [Gordonia phage Rosalind]AOE44691.1 hypothetical protein SEA_REMUS_87 [Gordonia phage Remus]